MDRTEVMKHVREANPDWLTSMKTQLNDVQYDCEADMLYWVWARAKDAFSLPLDFNGEDVYLRVELGTYKLVGLEIAHFKRSFLKSDNDAREAFQPMFQLLGDGDWRIQFRLPCGSEETSEFALLRPSVDVQLDYFRKKLPRVAPELVPA